MHWFKKWGPLYRPISWEGWMLCFFAVAFCVNAFHGVDVHSHSLSDTLYGAFPFVAPVIIILYLIAQRTNKD